MMIRGLSTPSSNSTLLNLVPNGISLYEYILKIIGEGASGGRIENDEKEEKENKKEDEKVIFDKLRERKIENISL